MGKGHKDNHAARLKRGSVAFEKKAKRRIKHKLPCNLCGTKTRPEKLNGGLCPVCETKYGLQLNPDLSSTL